MNNLPIKIRNAELEDLPKIVEIYNSTIASRMVTADTSPVEVESRTEWFYQHNEKRPLRVVELENKICAWISYQDFYGRPAYKSTAEVSIYLHEDTRGRGLGAVLLDRAVKECPSLRIENLLAFIFSHNVPSINLFKKFGFEQWGFLPEVAELDSVKRDLVIMGRRIIE
ncbi:phosphinothricin acetyltransferase [Bacillus sp. LL01]|uniref:GNAT family N-acetyltransferase n=1 Tax=Bacillus sp. LL01 TaxID=1665556 RepID=UPI00064D1B49|nr:GNAT family N-acetyltransferase [Bacillus sp. LL01]KMJ58418.1 phosphinothricin acetyltransferase [Bacillus sp. LL01]